MFPYRRSIPRHVSVGGWRIWCASLHADFHLTDARDLQGQVWNAYHINTGAELAIKVQYAHEDSDVIDVLPYEAAVYRVLRGHSGIPALHWYGMDSGGHVAVFDKVGATLDQLRRVCMYKFSLKTVLMLGIEMVSYIHIQLRRLSTSRGLVGADSLRPFSWNYQSRYQARQLCHGRR